MERATQQMTITLPRVQVATKLKILRIKEIRLAAVSLLAPVAYQIGTPLSLVGQTLAKDNECFELVS